ncbi:hypothetical protein BDF20DRAFT_829525, partial [Mycotypha africana]|uniref:uncharacterized protein n=1 Tax=Mycotypha africana TaxID=64632 RepID=UPI002300040B
QPGFVFLDFPDRDTAEKAYQQLQKINFGLYFKEICVEYATPNPRSQHAASMIPTASIFTAEDKEKAAYPISSTHGLLYPPNPHLKYCYPDPTLDIITNISYAIASVPRLYTQVLHLMNKLNMPPPFGPNVKEAKPSVLKKSSLQKDSLLASDESELEEDTVEKEDENERKRMLDADIEPTHEKVKRLRLTRMTAEKQKEAIHQNKQKAIKEKCLPMSELAALSAFRKYDAGEPNSKLYVKNLHKHVSQEDLQNIFKVFSKDVKVELMVKGKLKGQAFITFPDVTTAQQALECTNGFPLKGNRPMAVQFGRATKPSDEEARTNV